MSDEASWYKGVGKEFASHGTVVHRDFEYARGEITTRQRRPTRRGSGPEAWRDRAQGHAGFSMVSRRGFAEKQGLKLEILNFKNGATAHKALLAGEIDSIESTRVLPFSPARTAPISRFSDATGRVCRTG